VGVKRIGWHGLSIGSDGRQIVKSLLPGLSCLGSFAVYLVLTLDWFHVSCFPLLSADGFISISTLERTFALNG